MTTKNDSLLDELSQSNEITLSVTGRKSGRTISLPIWFVRDDDRLYLLPVKGSDTQWYKNVMNNSLMQIEAGGAHSKVNAVAVTDSKQVSAVVERFRAKYGSADVRKYYSKFDVAIIAELR